MNDKLQPRIRGAAYQNKDGSWSWEAVVTFGDMSVDDPEAIVINKKEGVFLNKESAVDDLRKASVEISKQVSQTITGKNPEGYIDLTKGFSKQSEEEFLGKSPFGKKFF